MTTLESKTTRAENGKACSCGGKCRDCQPSGGKERPDLRAAGNLAVQRLVLTGESVRAGDTPGPQAQEPKDAAAPAPGAAPAAAPPPAPAGGLTINVVQGAKELTKCGSAEFKVHWNVPAKSNGWIIQHVSFGNYVTKADGTLANSNNGTSEYWEAWEVKDGSVFVGPATGGSAHVADTFRTVDEGANKRGSVGVTGRVKFIPGYALNTPPWGHTVAAAGSLPTTTAAPPGWDDGDTLAHLMSISFNCTDADAAKHTQTVTTDP